MPRTVKRNTGPSVKEESVFGFFPAAKDIRALQSKRQWDSVKKLLGMMRKQDGTPSAHAHTGSSLDATETRHKKTPPSGILGITAATPSNLSGRSRMSELPPLRTSGLPPGVSGGRCRDRDADSGVMLVADPARQIGQGGRRLMPPTRSGSPGQLSAQAQAKGQTSAFKNFTLIGYSCGEFKREEAQYTDWFFQRSVPDRPRYFYVHPEWLSEGIISRHLARELRPSPFRYGWP